MELHCNTQEQTVIVRTMLIAVGVVCAAMLVMLLWLVECLLLRWRFQFGFRSLLLFVVVVSMVPNGTKRVFTIAFRYERVAAETTP